MRGGDLILKGDVGLKNFAIYFLYLKRFHYNSSEIIYCLEATVVPIHSCITWQSCTIMTVVVFILMRRVFKNCNQKPALCDL